MNCHETLFTSFCFCWRSTFCHPFHRMILVYVSRKPRKFLGQFRARYFAPYLEAISYRQLYGMSGSCVYKWLLEASEKHASELLDTNVRKIITAVKNVKYWLVLGLLLIACCKKVVQFLSPIIKRLRRKAHPKQTQIFVNTGLNKPLERWNQSWHQNWINLILL